MGIKIDWGKIVTNVITAFILAVLVGAAGIVWNGVTTVNTRIDSRVTDSEDRTTASILVFAEELEDIRKDIEGWKPVEEFQILAMPSKALDDSTVVLESLGGLISPPPRPIEELTNKERILNKIDTRQMEIKK